MGFMLTIITCYFLGSIPFGLLLTRYFAGKDIRNEGSGNIGATNVLRTTSKGLAFLTLFLDAAKGTFAAILAAQEGHMILGCIACLLGHMFPIWLGFKGGKGVATYGGILLVLSPIAALIGFGTWALLFWKTRISSLSALGAAIAVPIALFVFSSLSFCILGLFLSGLVIIKHQDNIRRLIKKQEHRF